MDIFSPHSSTIALFKFNRDKDFEERQKLIDILSNRDDSPINEWSQSFVHQLKNTKKANEALSTAIIQHDEVRANEVIQSVPKPIWLFKGNIIRSVL